MLTPTGFKRLRVADYLPIIQEQARELFGEDADLSDRTPLGRFIHLQALQRAEDNELAEQIWNSRFVDTSEGATLEANVKPIITRRDWLKATGEVSVSLKKGTTVPTGHLFKTPYNVHFRTLEGVTALEDAVYRIAVESEEYGGIGNVRAGDISIIVNKIDGLLSVTNNEPFFNGQDEETDAELQERYYESHSKGGSRRIEAIRANVLDEVPGVRACEVIENDSHEFDAQGRPPHSFETVILGGEDGAIAQAIYVKKPGGIRAFGKTTTIIITDDKNNPHEIGFSRAAVVDIFARVYRKSNSQFPSNGDEQLIQRVVEHIGGTHNDVKYDGLGMSVDVILARLEAALFAVSGLEDVRVELSINGLDYDRGNIPIDFPEVAETDSTKVEVLPLE